MGFCSLDHSEFMPHMLHTENSTQVDIILDHLQTNKSFTNSRFAIELLVVGEGNPEVPMFINPKKSLDDEHTPGIFDVMYHDLFSLLKYINYEFNILIMLILYVLGCWSQNTTLQKYG